MKNGDRIYFLDKDGEFRKDVVKEVVEVDGELLITPEYFDWIALSEDDLLDISDERVFRNEALLSDKMIKLSDAREWLKSHLLDYHDWSWSSFDDEKAVADFCVAMLKE